MLITIHVLLLFVLILISLIFTSISVYLSNKINKMRIKMNHLLEEKAKVIEEADHYAAIAKNPLGPLFAQNTEPLIVSFDTKGKITNVNETLLHKFGYTRRSLIGKNAVGTILPPSSKESDNMIYRLFKTPQLFLDAETETKTKNGQSVWVSWTNKIVYNTKGKPVSADAVGFDITKRKEMEAELQYLSSIDPQTGVMNRPALLQTGTTELKRAKRYGRALSVAVFKLETTSSDTSISDKQLKAATQLARRVARSVDYLGRIGDVEFALILPETDLKNVPFLFQRLDQHLSEYNKTIKANIRIKYAASELTKKSDTIDGLLNLAWRKLNTKK